MAVKATFNADFTSFVDQVNKTNLSMDKMIGTSANVQRSISRMFLDFSGQKVIAEATKMARVFEEVGGAAGLTERELLRMGNTARDAIQKMVALGVEVPPGILKIAQAAAAANQPLDKLAQGMSAAGQQATASGRLIAGMSASGAEAARNFATTTTAVQGFGASLSNANNLLRTFGIGLTVGAIVSFGREILEAGDQIQKMADQTGISTAEVQKLNYIAGQSGSSVQSLVGAVQNLQQQLGDNNSGAAGAMARLHINAEAFNQLNTYQQMTTLGEAVRAIKDPTEQASVAAALFGKTWKEILPAIKSGMKEIGDQAPIMADETIKSLDRVGDALKAARQQAVTWGGGFVVAIEGAGFAIGDFLSRFNPEHFSIATSQLLKLQKEVNDLNAALSGQLAKPAPVNLPAPLAVPGLPPDLEAIDRLTAAHTRTAAAVDTHAAALARVNQKIADATRDIGKLTDVQQQSVLAYEAMGLSAEEIGIKLGVSSLAVKKFSAATKQTDLYLESLTAHIGAKSIPTFQGLIMSWEQMKNTGRGLTYDGLIPMVKGFDDLSRAELAAKLYADELTKSHVALQNQLARTIGLMPDLSKVAKDHMGELLTATEKETTAVHGLATAFGQLAQIIGGTVGAMLSASSQMIDAIDAARDAAKKARDFPTHENIDAATASKQAAIYSGISLGSALVAQNIDTSGQASTGSIIAHDAGVGASIGANPALAVPTWGASVGVGAGAGAIVGLIRSGSEWRQIVRDIARDFGGIKVSDEFAEMIADLEDQTGLGSAQALTTQLDRLVEAAGGLNSENLDLFTGKLRDSFVMLGRNELSLAQTTQILDKNFANFAASATDSTGRLNDQMRELIHLNDEYGTHSRAIVEYLKSQGIHALGGLAEIIGGGVDDARLDAIKTRVDAAQKAVDALNAAGKTGSAEWKAASEELSAALADQRKVAGEVGDKLTDLGTIALATFAAGVASGQSFPQALAAAHPALDRLRKDFEALGVPIDDAGVKALLFYDKLFSGSQKTIGGLSGLASTITALGNMGKGVVSPEAFAAFERTGANMINDLFNAAKIGGATDEEAVRAALIGGQEFLHAAEREAMSRGETLDPDIALKIQQSKDLGLWVEAARADTDRLLDKLDDILHVLQGLPLAIHDNLPGSSDSRPRDTRTPGGTEAQTAARGALVTSHGLVYAAEGARILPFMPRGTDTVPAMLTPGERVLSVPQTRAYEGFLRGGPVPGSLQPGPIIVTAPTPYPAQVAPVTMHVTVNLTSDDAKDPERVVQAIREELRRNPVGLYADITTIARRAIA
jgi:hypothetical protein